MTQTQRHFINDGDRYAFDFKLCTYANGWAQVDSRQDAPYYGNWANPTRRQLVSYCEGDVTIRTLDTDEQFAAELRELCRWLKENTGGLGAVDPGFSPEMKADFERLGCSDLLH
jgi:hypothetical protein